MNELDAYGERTEQGTAPSGHVFRVSSRAYWDMEPPWPSGIEISVKAYAPGRIRRIWATRREGHAVAGTTRFHRRLRRRHLGGHSRTLATRRNYSSGRASYDATTY